MKSRTAVQKVETLTALKFTPAEAGHIVVALVVAEDALSDTQYSASVIRRLVRSGLPGDALPSYADIHVLLKRFRGALR